MSYRAKLCFGLNKPGGGGLLKKCGIRPRDMCWRAGDFGDLKIFRDKSPVTKSHWKLLL